MAVLLIAGCRWGGKPSGTAVINSKEVVTKCNDGIRVGEDIQRRFADRRSALQKQEESLHKLQNDPALSDSKSGKRDELQRVAQAYLEASQQYRQDVDNETTAKYAPILDKINKVLADYATEHRLISIQDKNGFAYVDPSLDITAEIIKRVDQVK
jgi:Skp family chaperone for outer membrane proteins